MLEGVDISNHQPGVDFDTLAKYIDFVYLKATEGTTYVDPMFQHYRAECKRVGLLVGYYHFLRWNYDPVQQAQHFAAVIGPRQPGELPPMVDAERTEDGAGVPLERPINILQTFLNTFNTGIYTYPYAWGTTLEGTARFGNRPLWLAAYSDPVNYPNGWNQYLFRQYTSTGRVPGIAQIVDRNRFDGTQAQLQAIAGIAPPQPPAKGIYFQETKHYVGGAFFEFWQHNGGLPIFGYPTTDEYQGRVGTWQGTVQEFERAVFEYKPEIGPPFVQLALRGETVTHV